MVDLSTRIILFPSLRCLDHLRSPFFDAPKRHQQPQPGKCFGKLLGKSRLHLPTFLGWNPKCEKFSDFSIFPWQMQPKCHVKIPQISTRILGSWVNPCVFFPSEITFHLGCISFLMVKSTSVMRKKKKTIVHGEMPWFLGKTNLVFSLKSPLFFYFF